MCGIAGALGYPADIETRVELVRQMGQAIHHRGPDDAGTFADDDVTLGSQRLKVIDLAGGHQPMATEDALHIVFNGEIFNFAALREELQRDGERFVTASDTEVVLRLYRRRGLDGFHAMNGMFAIAIWDARARQLHLVRDRMGVKPLYYYWDGRIFAFASEIKAFFALPELKRVLAPQAIWDYLTFRYVPGPGTIWKNVMKVQPGHRLTIAPGGTPIVSRWWDIPAPSSDQRADATLLEEFGALFSDAVNARMVADVPVGIMLSGGLDSSAVAAVAAQRYGQHLKTFSVSFADSPATDERAYARQVATHIGSDHAEVEIGEREFIDFLPDFVGFMDEPTADLASVPLYFVCRLARRTVTVALSGEGADEILAGYDFDRWWRQRAGAAGDLRQESVPPHMTNYMDSAAKRELLRHDAGFRDSIDVLRGHLQRAGNRNQLDQMLFLYCQDWLVEDLLMKADKMSMANSLELRTPFLDYRLVEWAARSSPWTKVGPDAAGNLTTKHVLRRFAAGLLPAEIIARPKRGFPVPVYDWLSSSLRSFAGDIMLGPGARLREWFTVDGLRQIFERGSADGAPAHDRHRLWNLIVLEYWLRRWTPA